MLKKMLAMTAALLLALGCAAAEDTADATTEAPELDPNAYQTAEAQEGVEANTVSLSYQDRVTVGLYEEETEDGAVGTFSLRFDNPSVSGVALTLAIRMPDETVLVQSGLVPVGYAIRELPVSAEACALLAEAERDEDGLIDAEFYLRYYDPETGARANVFTVIPVKITMPETDAEPTDAPAAPSPEEAPAN